jgi:hypothetical protein
MSTAAPMAPFFKISAYKLGKLLINITFLEDKFEDIDATE